MRVRSLCSVMLLLCFLQTSCLFSRLVGAGVAATGDPRIELVERRGEFESHYLGIEAVDGVEHFAFAVKGLLESRQPNQVFTLYIPDPPRTGAKSGRAVRHSEAVQRAIARQTTRENLADHPRLAVRVLAGSGSAREPAEDGPETERPTGIRLYTLDESYGVNLYYTLRGREYVRPVSVEVPYVERSGFLTGLQATLLFITIPIDILISPVVVPILAIVAMTR